jgi:hypothetical protein
MNERKLAFKYIERYSQLGDRLFVEYMNPSIFLVISNNFDISEFCYSIYFSVPLKEILGEVSGEKKSFRTSDEATKYCKDLLINNHFKILIPEELVYA